MNEKQSSPVGRMSESLWLYLKVSLAILLSSCFAAPDVAALLQCFE